MNHSVSKKSSSDRKEMWKIINFLNLSLVFIVSYFMYYFQATEQMASDTHGHLGIIGQYINGDYFIPHPMWHLGVYYLSELLSIDLHYGAGVFTALLVTLYAIIIYKIAQNLDGEEGNEPKWFLVASISLLIGPFFLMDFNPHIYIGQGSPSVWHNVTLIMVQPFALLSVFFTVKFFKTEKSGFFLLAILITFLSIFAKPSYILIFLPALTIFVLLERYFDKRQLLFTFFAIFTSVAALAYQFMNQFSGEGNDSVIFDFLGVWSLYSPNIAVSILLALGLPLLITVSNYQSAKENGYIKFSWLLVLFSMILFACFAESGRHYSDGNFGWSWNISLSLIYIFTIIEYFKQYDVMSPLIRYPILAIILYQLYVGWYFLIGMFNGVNYLATIKSFPLF